MARFFVGVALLLGLICGTIVLEGGNLLGLIGLTGFLIVLFPAVFAGLAVWKAGMIGQAFRDSLGKEAGTDATRSVRIWGFYERMFHLSGVLGWLLGIILILGAFGAMDPRLVLPRALSVSFLPIVYGIFFGILARVLRTRAEGKVKA